MGQILHTDIWPLLTSAEVNIRVAYEQKENLPIPKYITWNNSITKTFTYTFKQSRKICKLKQMSLISNLQQRGFHGQNSYVYLSMKIH